MDWEEMARPWLEASSDIEATHHPVVKALMQAASLSPGERVLDVGCGTGPTLIEAAVAVGASGSVTGVDVSPPLLRRAAERVGPNVTLIAADAAAHPFETHDVVIANFGIMFFDDSVAGFANLRRAVTDNGRLAATVWAGPQHNPWFSVARRIVDTHVADVPKPDPAGPGPMRFADPEGLHALLTAAGWTPSIETLDLDLLPPGPPEQVADLQMKLTAGMMLRGLDVPDSALARIRADLIDDNRANMQDGQVRIPARIHVVTAPAA